MITKYRDSTGKLQRFEDLEHFEYHFVGQIIYLNGKKYIVEKIKIETDKTRRTIIVFPVEAPKMSKIDYLYNKQRGKENDK